MNQALKVATILVVGLLLFASCDLFMSFFNGGPEAVIAVSGVNGVGDTVDLDGSASTDPDGDTLTYLWELMSAPDGSSASIEAPTSPFASITPDVSGDYRISLTVSDGQESHVAYKSFEVVDNVPPAEVSNTSVTVGYEELTLAWTDPSDADFDIVRITWSPADGDAQPIEVQPGVEQALVTNLTNGTTYQFTLQTVDTLGNVSGGVSEQGEPSSTANRVPTAEFTFSPAEPTAGEAVSFDASASSDPDGDPLTYAWDLNADGIDDKFGATISHTFQIAGNYLVQLTVQDDVGDSDVTEQTVVVRTTGGNTPPVAAFTYEPTSPIEGETVNFDASTSSDSDGDTLEYFWDLNGDGFTNSTSISPSYTYDTSESYEVTLRVTDTSGDFDEEVQTVVVSSEAGNTPPTASFTYTPGTPVEGDTVTFDAGASSDPDGDTLTYAWDFNDDGIPDANGVAVDRTYFTANNYLVRLTIVDTAGASHSISKTVTVTTEGGNSAPVASFTYSPVEPVAGDEISFDAGNSYDPDNEEISNYYWDFDNDGSFDAVGVTATHTFAESSTYTVSLRVEDPQGATNRTTRTITVAAATGNSPPFASFTYTPTAPVEGETISFDASGSSDPDNDDLTFSWDFNNDQVEDESGESTLWQFAADGSFTVRLTVTDSFDASHSVTKTVVVASEAGNSPPTAAFAFNPLDPFVDEQIGFSASESSDPDGDTLSFSWDFDGDGTVDATTESTTWTYTSAGTYQVSLVVSDGNGGTTETSQSVSVSAVDNAPPVADFSYSPTAPIEGDTVNFDGTFSYDPDEGDTLSYEWTIDGQPFTTDKPSYQFIDPGSYVVTLKVTDSAATPASHTISKTVNVIGITQADIGATLHLTEYSGRYPLGTFILCIDNNDSPGDGCRYTVTGTAGGTATVTVFQSLSVRSNTPYIVYAYVDENNNGGYDVSTEQFGYYDTDGDLDTVDTVIFDADGSYDLGDIYLDETSTTIIVY